MIHIYTLSDPRDGTVRYVGMSKNPRQRWYKHNACQDENVAKNAWIQELKSLRLKSVLTIIETVDTDSLSFAWNYEKHWIEHYTKQGAPLTNLPNVIEDFWKNYTREEWHFYDNDSED